uniref:Putative secreted protein n=1 Tax=Ixodes ricinus TaxID=34613 RepID=A0A6B0UMN1_IXORI
MSRFYWSHLVLAAGIMLLPLPEMTSFFPDFNMLLKEDAAAAVVEGMQTVPGLALGDRLGAKRKDMIPVLEADKVTASARRKKRRIETVYTMHRLQWHLCGAGRRPVPLHREAVVTACD